MADAVAVAIMGAGRIAEVHLSDRTARVRGARVAGGHGTGVARAASLGERFGVIGVVENTRTTPHGYDPCVEVLGMDGGVAGETMTPQAGAGRRPHADTGPSHETGRATD